MYTQGEFWGVTQELVQHDGQTSPNGGENQIHMSLARISKTIYKIKSQGRYNVFWHHK